MTCHRECTFFAVLMLVAIQFVADKIAYDTLYGYYGIVDLFLVSLCVGGLFSAALCYIYLKLDDMSVGNLAYHFALISFIEVILTAIVIVQYNYDRLGEWNEIALALISVKFGLLIKDSGAGNVVRMLGEHFGRFTDSALRLYIHCRYPTSVLQIGKTK